MSNETIETLQKRYAKLDKQQTVVQTQLGEAQKRLAELQDQATKEFGTDDVDALQKKLEAMKTGNAVAANQSSAETKQEEKKEEETM